MDKALQYLAGGLDLCVIAAAEEVGVEPCCVRRAMSRSDNHQPLQFRLAVVTGLDADLRVGDCGLERGGTLRRGHRVPELELHSCQQRMQRRRIGQSRYTVYHGFREEILPRDLLQ